MGLARREVVVVGDEIDLRTPVVIVKHRAAGRHHEIGGQRQTRRDGLQHVTFGDVELLERVGAEPLVVEQLARVHEVAVTDVARRDDLGEIVHVLGPERCSPGLVHRVDGLVALLAPLLEGAHGVVRVVEAVVAAVFVAHVPGHHIWVALVVLGHTTAQVQRVLAEHRARRAPMLTGTRPHGVAALVLPQHLRMGLGQPHRRGGGGGGEVYGDARLAELIDGTVQPVEIVLAFLRLDLRP